jgi:hypothetical protein
VSIRIGIDVGGTFTDFVLGALRELCIEGKSMHPKGRHVFYPRREQVLLSGQTLTLLDAEAGGFG